MSVKEATINYFNQANPELVHRRSCCLDAISYVIEKTKAVVSRIIKFIIECFSLVTRFIGSKTHSLPGLALNLISKPLEFVGLKNPPSIETGYETYLTPLEKEGAKKYIQYASIAAYVHSAHPQNDAVQTWIEPFGFKPLKPKDLEINPQSLPGKLEAHEFCFLDCNSLLKVSLVEKEGEVLIGFGALRSAFTEVIDPKEQKRIAKSQYLQVTGNLAGGRPALYEQASAFVETLLKHPKIQGKKVSLLGQCIGGSIAQYVGIKLQIPTVCLNCVPLGAGLQYDLGSEKLSQAKKYVEHVSAKSDFVSDAPVNLADQTLSLAGVRTPGNFGKRFSIPTAYEGWSETHDYILGSLMKYVGYDIRTKPKDLDPRDSKFGLGPKFTLAASA